jgi:hypothetical protein
MEFCEKEEVKVLEFCEKCVPLQQEFCKDDDDKEKNRRFPNEMERP